MKIIVTTAILLFASVYCYAQNFPNHSGISDQDWRTIPGKDFGDLKWYEIMELEGTTFLDLQRAFYKEWENKKYEKGQGYKQFKRWELSNNINPYATESTKPDILYSERSLPANWTLLGPSAPPSPPQGGNFSGWNNEGIGRVDVIKFDPNNATTIYAGTPNGGLWKSTNDGVSWSLISNSSWPNQGVSDIAIDPNNSNIIYASTGTREGGGLPAEGIMKSTNGGTSWTNYSLSSGSRIYRLLIDPNSSSKLIAATSSGISYSTDSGVNWTASTGVGTTMVDMEYKPGSSTVVYAANNGLLYKSTNGGISFTTQSPPFTDAQASRVSIAVSPDNTSAVYYMVCDQSNGSLLGIYKSLDEGVTFNLIADLTSTLEYVNGTLIGTLGDFFWGQAFYDWTINVNPIDEDEIIVGSISAFRTDDGGSVWKAISSSSFGGGSIHVDMHEVGYNPITNVPYIGCDGGLYKWIADNQQWNRLNDLSISQMYTLAASETNPDVVYCGLQDNGGFYNDDGAWSGVRIGDVLSVNIDPIDPDIIYGTTTTSNMTVFRSFNSGLNWTAMLSESTTGENIPSSFQQPKIRIHPTDRNTLYTTMHNVYKSNDFGNTWTNISNGNVGSNPKTILEVAESNPDYIYTSSGNSEGIYRTTNGGTSWTQITGSIQQNSYDITIDNTDPTHLYLVWRFGGIYESTDSGDTWTNITGNLTATPYGSIDYVKDSNDELYLIANDGIYYKEGSNDWVLFNNGFPDVTTTDIQVCEYDNTLKVSTYGRGLWSSPLEVNATNCYDPVPTVSPNGIISLCGTSTTLTASVAPSGLGYQWYKDSEIINGETSQTISPSDDGAYSVIYTGGTCQKYSSDRVTVITGCLFESCSDYNINSGSGPGNTTIVNVTGSFGTPASGSMVDICVTTEGDQSSTFEQFNIFDEDSNLIATTTQTGDCVAPWEFCYQVTDTQFNSWASDGAITFTFNPTNFGINPVFCLTNEACASITYSPQVGDCDTSITENGNPIPNGVYEASQTIISSGTVAAGGDVIFTAGTTICLDPGFYVEENATFNAFIGECGF